MELKLAKEDTFDIFKLISKINSNKMISKVYSINSRENHIKTFKVVITDILNLRLFH